ncbi:MAG TPA: transposase family protein [Spirillospora sp.]|nr:transposase family protein [Spirillospora sp.]
MAELIVGHRDRIGSRWRALNPGRQALLVLAHLRCNETFARLAAAFGVGLTTAHRYVTEVIALLAERAPDLREAMRIAARKAYVILDGTLAPIDRLYCSGRHHRHGVNIQVLTDPHDQLVWAPAVLPGSTHDLTAARVHGIVDELTSRAIACYADQGFVGAGGAIGTPYKRRKRSRLGRPKKLFSGVLHQRHR